MHKPDLQESPAPKEPWATAIFVANVWVWIVFPAAAALFCLIDGIKTWEVHKFVFAAIGGAASFGGWYFMHALEHRKP